MEKWTIHSDRPPTPEDSPFYGADLNLFMHATGWVGVRPKAPKQFEQVAKTIPTLQEELARLCRTNSPQHLSALADALRASAKGAVPRGPRGKAIDAGLVATMKAMLHSGEKEGEIVKRMAPQMPGPSAEAQEKRARREIKRLKPQKSGFQVSHLVALQQWAAVRATQQLQQEVSAGILQEVEAIEQLPGRISAFMSRANDT